MILIVGASGRLGRAMAERLLQEGVPFRAACRNAAKAHWLAERGVDVVPLDLESREGLAASLIGVTAVISCIHGLLGKSRQSIQRTDIDGQERLIDASAQAGVKRFVFVSALGASPDHPSEFWKAKARTEHYLRESGLEFVILRPSAFMDLYAHDLIGAAILRRKRAILLGAGDSPRNLVAVADVAAAAEKALCQADLAGRTIDFGGWENLTDRDVVAVYARLTGEAAKVRTIPAGLLRIASVLITPFHAGIARILRSPQLLAGRRDLCIDTPNAADRLGIEPVRLADYAKARFDAEGAATP